ncbi:hypothetical protein O1D55_003086 [Vibrio cholerae]|uniref:hypothetical protein n=1 Tax=Vibrio cholerae TaxID=666 RepID=UPI00053C47B7|nr:hypothetical protein [Vibrio cholerae]EJL6466014.1 hypothetical protein [Vibrio cholerae]EKF9298852.1 hypothetical protein [Vibrio cholerae]EKF9936917.1 hypothetical protein [Vibrio cholerae]EMC2457678.1 hypothetical protein [Vibrio cholerae]TXZ11026.1 hypothetical protein FXE57_10790 [Vibrio cholerae]
MKDKILMVCYGGGHVSIIEPLYLSMKENYDITILALTAAAPYLERKKIPYVTFYDYKHLFPSKVVEYGKKLMLELETGNDINPKHSLYYLGCSYYDLVDNYGEVSAKKRYQLSGRSEFFPENTLNKIIGEIKPDIVVTTNSPRAERAALSAAKKRGVPTLCINDGVWIEGATSGVADIDNENLACTICVLSQQVKDRILSKRTTGNSNIVVTGTPVFDSVKMIKREKSSSAITILYADCDLPESLPNYPNFKADPLLANKIRSKLDFLAKEHGWNVIFRPHPNQNIDYSCFRYISISDKNESLHKRLAQSDLVITNISTVGVEAKVMGLGLVSIEGTVYNQYNSFYKLGMSTPIFSEDDIYEAVKEEINKDNADLKNLYQGSATENIISEIIMLLNYKS